MLQMPRKPPILLNSQGLTLWFLLTIFLAILLLVMALPGRQISKTAGLPEPVLAEGILPLSFIPNAGQSPEAVQFEVRSFGGNLQFYGDGVRMALPGTAEPTHLLLQFEGSEAAPAITGREPLAGTVNYLIGDDQTKWQTGIPTYGAVVYEGLYPGIDLHYSGRQAVNGPSSLKGTYTVAAGADPSLIRWRYQAADGVQLDGETGDLLITAAGPEAITFVESAPVSWQEIGGQRVPVESYYLLAENGSVSFGFGVYDPAYPLIIDPTLTFSTYLGTAVEDAANGIAVDNVGNIYVVGWTESVVFPVTGDAFQPTSTGGTCFSPPPFNVPFPCNDGFVTKLSPDGSTILYSTYLGGTRDDGVRAIALDSSNNIYLTGWTTSVDFPTMNPIQPTNGSGNNLTWDSFVARLAADGSSLHYSTYLGGSGRDNGDNLALDNQGNAYVIGWTESTNFPTVNAVQGTYGGGFFDGTITKVNAAGTACDYSSYLGGNNLEYAFGIDVDGSGNAYITGFTLSDDFPTFNAMQPVFGGGIEAYVTKLTAAGDAFVYSTYFGNNDTRGFDIRVNDGGYVYLVGATSSTTFPTVNPLQATYSGTPYDGFVSRFVPDGSALDFSTYLGGDGNDVFHTLTLGEAGHVYFTGWSSAADFPLSNPIRMTPGGNTDAIVGMISADLTALDFSTYLGGTDDDFSYAVAIDNAGRAHIVGRSESTDFPTLNALQPDFGGGETDSFIAKIDLGFPDIPQASFISSSPDMLGQTTVFTNTSAGGNLSFQWDFGDGSTAVTQTNPVYIYPSPGFFTVTLTATNPVSSTVFMDTVEIIDVPPPSPDYYLFLPAVIKSD